MNLFNNPEIRRNAWLQCSKAGLIAAPLVVLVLAVIVSYKTAKGNEYLSLLGLLGFVLVTTLWGASRTFGSVMEEVTARTWDWQRMSAMSAWNMMLGKLFGAPLFLWFVGLCCLLVTAFFSGYAPSSLPLIRLTLLALVGTVLLHATCLAGGTAYAGANIKLNSLAKWVLRISLFFVLILPLLGIGALLPLLGYSARGSTLGQAGKLNQTLDWWGIIAMNPLDFSILSCVVFATWALYVANIAMARQIKAPHRWWVWLLLPLCVGVWFGGLSGLAPNINRAATVFLIATLAISSVGLPLLIVNPLTQIHVARLANAVKVKKPLGDLFELMPAWVPAVLLALLTTALALLCLSLGEHSFLKASEEMTTRSARNRALFAPTILNSGLHFLSMALLLCVFTLKRSMKKPIAWALFTWFALFLLLPLLLRTLGFQTLANVLDPQKLDFYTGFAFYALHCAVFFVAVVWVMKRERQN